MSTIGVSSGSARAILSHFGLAPFRTILPPEEFAEAAQQTGCAPRRKRPLIPEVVAWLMMYVSLQTTSMTQGLCQAWGLVRAVCPSLQGRCVTEEAFCQARKQVTIRFWRRLWDRLVLRFEMRFRQAMLWKNAFRVLAIDSSAIYLPGPPLVRRFFDRGQNSRGERRQPQAKLLALCSVFTGFCFAFKFTGKRFTEQRALEKLVRTLRPRDLVLMDRGFFSLCRHLAYRASRRSFSNTSVQSTGRPRTLPRAAWPR
jgi:hypothetical protein